MAQIRNTKIQDIKDKINASRIFSINDFKLEFPDVGNVLAKIVLRGSSKYSFSIEENYIFEKESSIFNLSFTPQNYKKEKTFQTLKKPGYNKNFEVDNHKDIDECISQISSWLSNLDEDLKNEEIFDNIEDFSNIDEFEKKLDKNFPNENEKFTNEEKENLIQKINELQSRIEKLESNDSTKKSIQSLEESKVEIKTYPKKAWWLKFYNRFHSANKGLILLNDLKDNFTKLIETFVD
jgi:hypothetical protein